jgi:hypothetical protein
MPCSAVKRNQGFRSQLGLTMPRRLKPVPKISSKPFRYAVASEWQNMSQIMLGLAIRRLAREELRNLGPARARFREKRLRAVETFRSRFGDAPALGRYGQRRAPPEVR